MTKTKKNTMTKTVGCGRPGITSWNREGQNAACLGHWMSSIEFKEGLIWNPAIEMMTKTKTMKNTMTKTVGWHHPGNYLWKPRRPKCSLPWPLDVINRIQSGPHMKSSHWDDDKDKDNDKYKDKDSRLAPSWKLPLEAAKAKMQAGLDVANRI